MRQIVPVESFFRTILKALLRLTSEASRTEVSPFKVPLATHLGAEDRTKMALNP